MSSIFIEREAQLGSLSLHPLVVRISLSFALCAFSLSASLPFPLLALSLVVVVGGVVGGGGGVVWCGSSLFSPFFPHPHSTLLLQIINIR